MVRSVSWSIVVYDLHVTSVRLDVSHTIAFHVLQLRAFCYVIEVAAKENTAKGSGFVVVTFLKGATMFGKEYGISFRKIFL
jgi:hypothetical protein